MRGNVRVHHLQHVPFEGLGSLGEVLRKRGHQLTATHLYLGEVLPPIDTVDWLIVLGGPMGVYDVSVYPWLHEEKVYIRNAVDAGKAVLGICLGAQLIADVMGAQVRKNGHREIGWFPIRPTAELRSTIFGNVFTEGMEVFHWHGDTFDIPPGGVLLASSEACTNQGFVIDNRVVALQFHLETTMNAAKALIENCGHELDGSRYVQSAIEMLSVESRFNQINLIMHSLLDRLETHTT